MVPGDLAAALVRRTAALQTQAVAFPFDNLEDEEAIKARMVDQITLSSNTPGSSTTLIFWLREVAAMRQAA